MWPEPVELRSALKVVREQHPYSSTGTIARSARADVDASAVWDRLLSTPETEQAAAVGGLTRLEVGLLAYGASAHTTDPAGLRILRVAAQVHESFSMHRVVVELFVASDGDEAFAGAARKHVERKGISYWRHLTETTHPLSALCADYLQSGVGLDGFLQGPNVGFAWSVAIIKAARRLLLEPARVGAALKREGVETFDRWLTLEYPGPEKDRWFMRYLQAESAHRWSASDFLLRMVQRRYQDPTPTSPFWMQVDAELIAKFRRWLLDAHLTDALGETDRTKFWRNYLDVITSCVRSADKTAVFIQTPRWFAVQFVEMGRATFIFLGTIPGRWKYLDLDDLYYQVRNSGRIGRYAHHGYNWQLAARSEIKRVMRTYPG